MENQYKRQTAFKLNALQIVTAPYVKEEDQWTPNYLLLGSQKVSRVNIMGIIVAVESDREYALDDGSATLQIRSFDDSFANAAGIGDTVQIVGKPREYNGERYLMPEIISKIDEHWLKVRKEEILDVKIEPIVQETKQETVETAPKVEEEVISEEKIEEVSIPDEQPKDDPSTKIFNLIKELDMGSGVLVEEIIKQSDADQAEKIIENLLKEGEIFEIKPGIVKVLE